MTTEDQGDPPMTARSLAGSMSCLVLVLAASVASGAAQAQGIQVVDAWSRPTPPGIDVGVAYFTIRNAGKSDRLLRVSSPVAKRAELHVSSMKGGIMRMEPLSAVVIGSGGSASFEPNGRHVMLVGLKRPLKQGDAFPLFLTFAKAGRVEVQVRVGDMSEAGTGEGMDYSRPGAFPR